MKFLVSMILRLTAGVVVVVIMYGSFRMYQDNIDGFLGVKIDSTESGVSSGVEESMADRGLVEEYENFDEELESETEAKSEKLDREGRYVKSIVDADPNTYKNIPKHTADIIEYVPRVNGVRKFDPSIVKNNCNRKEFLAMLNGYRAEYGLEPLVYDTDLEQAAKMQVTYMYEVGEDTHYNPIGDLGDRVDMLGVYKFDRIRENCAYHPINHQDNVSRAILNGYIDSPPHNETLLNDVMESVGIYSIRDDEGNLYNTMVFGEYVK